LTDDDKRQLKFIGMLLLVAFAVAGFAVYASLWLFPPTP